MFPAGRAEAWSSRCASAVENDYRRCGGIQPEVEAWNVDASLRLKFWLRVSEIGQAHPSRNLICTAYGHIGEALIEYVIIVAVICICVPLLEQLCDP